MPGGPHAGAPSSGGGGGGAPGGSGGESPRRAFASASAALSLAILGSSVLPLPYAISRLGVLPGMAIMLAVAGGNALAGTLLLRAAGCLGSVHSFEGLAAAVGGRPWRLATQVCLMLLLFGNLCGDLCLLADMGTIAVQQLCPGAQQTLVPVRILVAGGGRLIMALLALAVVFPLSCLRRMRELEQAAMVGVAFVIAMTAVVVRYSLAEGLPAVASGELPLWRPALAADIPEAVGVLSFAFYLTPLLLPLLREMPAGKLGVDLTCRALQLVTLGVAFVLYAVIGFFAAARYGLRTEGDVLVNGWLPGRWEGALSAGMAVYLSLSMAPMTMTLRGQLQNLVWGDEAQAPRQQQVALTAACVVAPLLVALPWPTAAEKMFAMTGATAVCAVVYVLPVAIHLRLYLRHGLGSSLGGRVRWKPRRLPGGSAGAALHQHRRRSSFSFDRRGGHSLGGEGGVDARWLLQEDHHRAAAAGGGAWPTGPPAAAAALTAQQQQQQQRRGEGEAAGEEEAEEGGGGARLGLHLLHHRSDLSLSRWLRGQSYDSFGGADSLPQTPVSPGGRQRDSMDSFREAPLAGSWDRQHHGWVGDEASAAALLEGAQLWSADGPALPAPALDAVPEAAAVVPAAPPPLAQPGSAAAVAWPVASTAAGSVAASGGAPAAPAARGGQHGSVYPCLADAGSGRQAVLPVLVHLVLPLTVLVLGTASSVSALALALAALRHR